MNYNKHLPLFFRMKIPKRYMQLVHTATQFPVLSYVSNIKCSLKEKIINGTWLNGKIFRNYVTLLLLIVINN